MATWNEETQFGPSPDGAGTMKECGSFACTAAEVDGASLSIPTKFSRIRGGLGITTDGLVCYPMLGLTSNGVVVFTRCGAPNDETPMLFYVLWGY